MSLSKLYYQQKRDCTQGQKRSRDTCDTPLILFTCYYLRNTLILFAMTFHGSPSSELANVVL